MQQTRRLIVVALALCACAHAALAQNGLRDRERSLSASIQIADELRRAHFHHGPFYLLSTFQLSDIGYESSFYVPTADSQSGFRFGIQAPTRLYFVPRKKTVYSIDARPAVSFLNGGTRRTSFGYNLRGDAQYLLNHLYLDVYGETSNQLRADVAEIARLLTEKTRTYGVSGELKYSSRTSATFNASANRTTHPLGSAIQPSAVPVQLLDRTGHNYRITLNHKTFPLTSLFVASELSDYSFTTAAFKNSRRTFAGAGFVNDSGRAVTRFEVGVGKLDFFLPGQHDFSGALGNITSSKKFGRAVTGNLAASRDVDFSIFTNNNYFVADRFSAGLAWDATRRLQLTLQDAIGSDSYDTAARGPGGLLLKRHDRFSFPSVGFTYGFARLRGGFDVGYVDRTSNFHINEDQGMRILLRLSFTP